MRALVIIPALALALAGCQAAGQIGSFTASDAQNAAAIDPGDAACYTAIGAIGSALGGGNGDTGILTAVAVKRAGQAALNSASCAPIEADVLATVLKATPVGPLIP